MPIPMLSLQSPSFSMCIMTLSAWADNQEAAESTCMIKGKPVFRICFIQGFDPENDPEPQTWSMPPSPQAAAHITSVIGATPFPSHD